MENLIAFIVMACIDLTCYKFYGSPSLSILIAKAHCSKNFKWLTWNIWGDDSWIYEQTIKKLDKRGIK